MPATHDGRSGACHRRPSGWPVTVPVKPWRVRLAPRRGVSHRCPLRSGDTSNGECQETPMAELTLNLPHTALVLVDLQGMTTFHPDGAYASSGAAAHAEEQTY